MNYFFQFFTGRRPALPPCSAGPGFRVPHSCAVVERWVPTLWDAGETGTVLLLLFLMLPGTAAPHTEGDVQGCVGSTHWQCNCAWLRPVAGTHPVPRCERQEETGPGSSQASCCWLGRSTALLLALWLHVALVSAAWHDKPPNCSV